MGIAGLDLPKDVLGNKPILKKYSGLRKAVKKSG